MAPTERLQVPLAPFLQHAGGSAGSIFYIFFNSHLMLVEVECGEELNDKSENVLLSGLLGSEGL